MFFDENGNIMINNELTYQGNDYQELKNKALDCKNCHLREKATQVVMGDGNINNHIMFIGEAPGYNEDQDGKPFIGRAGKLLDKIFAAVGIKREDVYISNIVKCRPQNNRTPNNREAKKCSPILASEIKIIDPKVIVPMGSAALKFLIDNNASITRVRGKWIKRGKYYFLPTFHPSYLLRNDRMKKYAWQDFKIIKKSIKRIEELKKSGEL